MLLPERRASVEDVEYAESSEGGEDEGGPTTGPTFGLAIPHAHTPTVIKRGLSHSDGFMATVLGDLDIAEGNIFLPMIIHPMYYNKIFTKCITKCIKLYEIKNSSHPKLNACNPGPWSGRYTDP